MSTVIYMRKTYVSATPTDADNPCLGCAAFDPTARGHQFNDPLCAALPCVPLDEPHIIFKEQA